MHTILTNIHYNSSSEKKQKERETSGPIQTGTNFRHEQRRVKTMFPSCILCIFRHPLPSLYHHHPPPTLPLFHITPALETVSHQLPV